MPREAEVPGDLDAALRQAGVREAFDALAFTHRKEHVLAIESAKSADTRARRVAEAVAMALSNECLEPVGRPIHVFHAAASIDVTPASHEQTPTEEAPPR